MLMSYGDGFDRALRTSFLAIGQDLIIMGDWQTSEQAGGLRSGRRVRLEFDDVEAIREAVPLVRAISPELMRNNMKPYAERGRSSTWSARSGPSISSSAT